MKEILERLGDDLSAIINNSHSALAPYPSITPLISSLVVTVNLAIANAICEESVKCITGDTQAARVYKAITGKDVGIPKELIASEVVNHITDIASLKGVFDYALKARRLEHGVYNTADEGTMASYDTETGNLKVSFESSEGSLEFVNVDGRYNLFYSSPIDPNYEISNLVGISKSYFMKHVLMPLYAKLVEEPVVFENSTAANKALGVHLDVENNERLKAAVERLWEQMYGNSVKINIGSNLVTVDTSHSGEVRIVNVSNGENNYYSWYQNPVFIEDTFSQLAEEFILAVYERYPVMSDE